MNAQSKGAGTVGNEESDKLGQGVGLFYVRGLNSNAVSLDHINAEFQQIRIIDTLLQKDDYTMI